MVMPWQQRLIFFSKSMAVNGRSQRLLEPGPPPDDPSEPNPPPFQCDITRVLQKNGRRFTINGEITGDFYGIIVHK